MRVPQRRRIFVGCEGDSEQSYVKFLTRLEERFRRPVHLDSFNAGGGDPLAIVERSLGQMKRKAGVGGPFALSAVIIDGDRLGKSPQRDARAGKLMRQAGAKLIVQQYDFECFLFRHVEGNQHATIGAGRSSDRVRSVWPDYEKPADARWLADRLDGDDVVRAASTFPVFRSFLDVAGFN